jgi:hypothetical protein
MHVNFETNAGDVHVDRDPYLLLIVRHLLDSTNNSLNGKV